MLFPLYYSGQLKIDRKEGERGGETCIKRLCVEYEPFLTQTQTVTHFFLQTFVMLLEHPGCLQNYGCAEFDRFFDGC